MLHVLDGAFYNAGRGDTGTQYSEYGYVIGFEASRSNPIYGSSETVTPRSAVLDTFVKAKPSAANGENGKTPKLFTVAYFVKLPN